MVEAERIYRSNLNWNATKKVISALMIYMED
jgi:predicted transcriptional regulator